MDVGGFLKQLGLEEHGSAFAENGVDGALLRELTNEDLKDLGIARLADRKRLLKAIAALNAEETDAKPLRESAQLEQEGERRYAAVLFADLVGYTRLTEELGAEETHALLQDFFERADAAVEKAGGRVDKHIGDCVMAVFGAPYSHGNDGERAIHAALEMKSAVEQLAAARDRDIGIHVGLTMGSVVAKNIDGAEAEYAVVGGTVNLASRLTDAAAPGEILISDGLYRALEDKLECEEIGSLEIKGYAEPVTAWRLIRFRDVAPQSSRFIGRESERRQFDSILDACRDGELGQVVLVRGEAGIGKTRLTEEFQRKAELAGYICHRGLVLDFGVAAGRDAIRSVLRSLLEIPHEADGEALQAAAEAAIASGAVEEGLKAHLYDLLNAPQPERLRYLYDAMDNDRRTEGRGRAIAQVLNSAAQRQHRLLIVEDAHWAKPPLLRALAQLASAVGDCNAVLVITTRGENDPLDRGWRAAARPTPITTIDLSPLRNDDAVKLCQARISDPGLIEGCVKRAAGNPLFLEQLLRHSREGEESRVPGTIQSLVQASVDRLAQGEKQAIQACAVIGQRIDAELLFFLVPKDRFTLSALIEKDLLRPHGAEYLFVHALIRDAVYETLLTPTRKSLHLQAAEWYENRDARLYAEHLALADSPLAAKAFLRAAREEIAKYHYDTAVGLLERGLALSPEPSELVELCLVKGETLHDWGRMEEAKKSFATAFEAAGDAKDRCRALIGLASVKRVTDDVDGALADLVVAEDEAAAAATVEGLARIHFLRGNLLFPKGEIEGCLRAHEVGLEFARKAARPDYEAASLGGLGDAEYMRGRMQSARRRLAECVDVAREHGLGRIEVANQAQIAHTMIYTASQQEAYEAACAAVEAAREVGHMRAEINARAAIVKTLFTLARHEENLREIELHEEVIERLGATRFLQIALMFRARALGALGDAARARQAVREGLDFAKQSGFAFHGPSLLSARAVLEDDAAAKRASMAEAEAAIAAGCVGHNQYRVYADGIDVAVTIEDADLLQHYIALLDGFPPGETAAWCEYHAQRGRALLARLQLGDGEETRERIEDADRRCQALRMDYWRIGGSG